MPVGEGTDAQIGWDGSDLLQGTNDIIGAFSNLVTNLTTGTSVAVRSSIDDLDLALDQLSEARSRVANEFIVAEDAKDLTVSLDFQRPRSSQPTPRWMRPRATRASSR